MVIDQQLDMGKSVNIDQTLVVNEILSDDLAPIHEPLVSAYQKFRADRTSPDPRINQSTFYPFTAA